MRKNRTVLLSLIAMMVTACGNQTSSSSVVSSPASPSTPSSSVSSVSSDIRNTQHYIGIPVNVYYDILGGDNVNFYAYAGGTVEKCVTNHYQIQSTPVINHKESVKGVQLSVDAGIGVEFMLGNHVGLYLDPSLRYYFHCGQPASIRSAQPLTLGFELGLRFNL